MTDHWRSDIGWVKIFDIPSWVSGYRPTQIKITFNLDNTITGMDISVVSVDPSSLAYDSLIGLGSGEHISTLNLNFAGKGDIDRIEMYVWNEIGLSITNIQFLS